MLTVLGLLHNGGCRVCVGGGWGVDALVGRQTRAHRDLDLAIDADDVATASRVLHSCGYEVETDWRPVRVEFAAVGRGWVDVHPVVFDKTGRGRQAGLDGSSFDYPADAFVEGELNGIPVPCLSRDQQVRFHHGYQPRDLDQHDLRLLRGALGPAGWPPTRIG